MPWTNLGGDSAQDRKIPRTMRNHKSDSERSKSPGTRSAGILPTLAVLVPGASTISNTVSSGDNAVRKTLGLRSRSHGTRNRSRSGSINSSLGRNSDDIPRSSNSSSNDETTRGRPRSSSLAPTVRDQNRSWDRSVSRKSQQSSSAGDHSSDALIRRYRMDSDGSIRAFPSTNPHMQYSANDRRQYLRHTNLPDVEDCGDDQDKLCFLRVYRPDGTYGTIACSLRTTAERILQMAARKFFINDASDYHLVAVLPDRIRVFAPGFEPVLMIHKVLVLSGFRNQLDQLNAVCRDDTSFLCRIVLANINDPLRPPLLKQGQKELIMVNTDVSDAPNLVCAVPSRVESMDLSRSSFHGTTLTLSRLKTIKLHAMSVPQCSSITRMLTSPSNLMGKLTTLELCGNGLSDLNGLDLTMSPNLSRLDLRGNDIKELPVSLLHLPYLKVLLCGSNALTTFDSWNPGLYHIDLSYNKFKTLCLPEEVARQMVNLKVFQICANGLEDYPSNLRLLPTLKYLDARHNKINDTLRCLPATLETLIASYNKPLKRKQQDSAFSSNTVSEKTALQGLVNLRNVRLEGVHSLNFPDKFMISRISRLNLKNNNMTFIPEALFESTPELIALDLSNNNLSRLPDSICNLLQLEDLLVANNLLMDFPESFLDLPEMRTVDLHANDIKTISGRIFDCPKLKLLNLASNLLTTLPLIDGGNTSLVSLILLDNQLTEDCFETILQLSCLQVLDVSYNFLSEIPSGIFAKLPILEELYLGGNRLMTLPRDEFAQATQLQVLCMNSNRLHILPAELSKASQLEVLDVSANQLRYNVANWPFDWNWRWNTRLKYLNLSSNERLEIRRVNQFIPSEGKIVDLGDFCTLPHLKTLGLMDVTLTTNSIPFQSETCRVRTFGSDAGNKYKVGIADKLGYRPLANNDLVLERFRNNEDESLIALFDGHCELANSGNKISHIAQEIFGSVFKRELAVPGVSDVDALRNAFLTMHREIGNIAFMTPAEVSHTALGHISATASRLTPADRSSGTGATVVYIKGEKIYIATVGGASVVLSRANGTHAVLSKPLPPVAEELDRIRAAGGIVDQATSSVNNISPYPRMIGCYTSVGVFSAAPLIYEYDCNSIDPSDQIIIGTRTLWQYMRYETAADISRSTAHDPVMAATKIRDFAMAYGCRDRMMIVVLSKPQASSKLDGTRSSTGDLHDIDIVKKRRLPLPEDSTLARLGSEISPPFGEVTMVFTDIKSSTYLWENFPSVMQSAIKTHNSLMRRSIRLMDGYEVKNEGDAFIVSFHTPVKALIWCLTVQQHLVTAEWPHELLEVDDCKPIVDERGATIFRGLSVRMGIHCGRPVTEPDPVTHRMDYFGPMVNRASRISGVALGGQISVSTDFLNMLNRALEAHRLVYHGVSLEEAYSFTNLATATALDKSASVLDHTDYVIKELGELKLRGIENLEHIYNVYPASLAGREQWYEKSRIKEQRAIAEEAAKPSIAISNLEDQTLNENSQNRLIPQGFVSVRQSSQISQLSNQSGDTELSIPPRIMPATPSFVETQEGDPSVRRKSSIYSDDFNFFDGYGNDEHYNGHSESTPSVVSARSRSNSTNCLVDPKQPPANVPFADPLQAMAMRLEAICTTIANPGSLFADNLQLLQLIEPVITPNSDLAGLAHPLWLTRIENTICRLERASDWP